MPRSFKIYPGDVEKYGYTLGCPGCDAIIYKTARRGHVDRCKARLEKAMKEDPANAHRVTSTTERFDQYFARRVEESDMDQRPTSTGQHDHADMGVDVVSLYPFEGMKRPVVGTMIVATSLTGRRPG